MPARKQKPETPPRLPKDHKSALVVIGDGIGNIIQQSPLLVAASRMFEHVDVWLPRSNPTYCGLLLNTVPNLRRVMNRDSFGEVSKRKYSAGFHTWLVRRFRNSIPTSYVYGSQNPVKHKCSESDAAVLAIRRIGFDEPTPHPVCAKGHSAVRPQGNPVIGFTTGSLLTRKWKAKRYQHYGAVFEAILQKHPTATFVHVGIKTDTDVKHKRVIDCRGKLSLMQSVSMVAQCDVFIGNDTGLAHIAAAQGIPTTVVFGPTQIQKNIPPHNAKAVSLQLECQPCHNRKWFNVPGQKAPCKLECLTNLSPLRVALAVMEDLNDT